MFGRAGFRLAQAGRPRVFPRRIQPARRVQSTDAAPAPESIASRMWNSPVGVKTVHFWAPVMKWCLVIAGISDFARPAEKLSLTQNLALTATGTIWTRLAAVNFFLACVGTVQVSRILSYQRSVEGKSALEAVKQEAKQQA